MTKQSTTANAGADESPVVNTNMSVTDFAARRIGEMTPKAPGHRSSRNPKSGFDRHSFAGLPLLHEPTEVVFLSILHLA